MRPIEPGIGARCIGIRVIECGVLPCPLICAVAGAAIKTHAITQPRRTDFLQFIALQVSRKLNPPGFEKCRRSRIGGNVVITFGPVSSPPSDARRGCRDIRTAKETRLAAVLLLPCGKGEQPQPRTSLASFVNDITLSLLCGEQKRQNLAQMKTTTLPLRHLM